MLKKISAALLVASMIGAPAMAASSTRHVTAPVTKSVQAKPALLNANAKMTRHHKHYRHHRAHKKMGALKTHLFSKAATKHVAPASKRG
ncbi:MAG: hypothetical protein QOD09_1929 [Bradyrhizobium sp.]|jgi:hypothetical protein|nr:hypothetical protein [Bradyrhizobium sp.]